MYSKEEEGTLNNKGKWFFPTPCYMERNQKLFDVSELVKKFF